MDAAALIAGFWLAFAATHMTLSSVRLRPRLVAALGERPFLGVYSLVALATFVPMVSVYFGNKHAGPALWYLGALPGMRWLVYLGMGVAFALVVAGNTRPSPASIAAGKPEPKGVLCVTRHPLFMGVGLFGLLHLLVVPVNAAELAFFGGFPLFAVVGCRHQDKRKLAAGDEGFRHFHAATPFLPSPAGVPEALRSDAIPIAVGIAATVAVRWFHPQLFGG
ncbi:MAG: NnrU family protein [Myxococcota bacterium]